MLAAMNAANETRMNHAQTETDAVAAWRQRIRSTTFANYHYSMAVALEREGATGAALTAYRTALETQPDLAVAAYRLHMLLLKLDEAGEAAAIYPQALSTDAHYIANGMMGIARELMEAESWAEGESMFQSAISNGCLPTDDLVEACLLLGRWKQQQGSTDSAIEILSRGVNAEPESVPLLEQLGSAFLTKDDLSSADPVLRKGLSLEPFSASMTYLLSWVRLLTCQFEDAAVSFDRAISLGYKYPGLAQWRQGLCLLALGRYDDVMKCYSRQLGGERQTAVIQSYRGLCLQAVGRLGEAEQMHRQACASPGYEAEKLANRALTASAMGDAERATVLHHEALEQERSLWPIIAFAFTLAQAGRLDEAISLCAESTRLRPVSVPHGVSILPGGRKTLGPLYARLGFPLQPSGPA